MPRLPAPLEPLFPVGALDHRLATRTTGRATRAVGRVRRGARAVPWRGYERSLETASHDPEHTRVHPGADAERVERELPTGEPAGHWLFESLRTVEFGPRFTLEITDGTVVGNYAAHLTPTGVLDLETSPYFDILGWHEHPVYLRPRLPRRERVEGTLLSLATRGTGVNYYHVVMDMLERYAVFAESMPSTRPDVLLVSNRSRYAAEYLHLLGLDAYPQIHATKHLCLQADVLLAPSLPNRLNLAPPWTTRWLRERLPAQQLAGRPRRIYVTRGGRRNTRRVTNEAALLRILRPLGFEVFDPGAHTVQEQIDHFAAAEVVVGPHGAGLTNLVFAQPGVKILELFAPRYVNPGYWTIAENLPGATYRYLLGEPADPRPPGAPMKAVYADITVDVDRFRAILDELLAS